MSVSTQRRGTLRVFLGAAPGVGKTFAMLDEAQRRRERGIDVAVGIVETHDRALTAARLDGLEVLPRRSIEYRGTTFGELDVPGAIARRPDVLLVDELAHTNIPGSDNQKRWQDVEQILAAGINVVTTVNIQHLESLNDVVESITGIHQRETIPDDVVRRADQIELVDMSPDGLRRRLAHGNVYAPEKIDAALNNYFRLGNLTALRELALLWTADRVDDALAAYRRDNNITTSWPARERVVVAVTGGSETETLVRRGARIAQRPSGGELVVLHVARGDGLSGPRPDAVARHRAFVESLGGTWHSVIGDDIAETILEFARGMNANQIVLGATRRSRLAAAAVPGVSAAVVRGSGDIDVLIVTHERAGAGRHRPTLRRGSIGRRRLVAAWVLALVGPPLVAVVLHRTVALDSLATVLLVFLATTVGVALAGGLLPALVAALASGLLANYLFTPPVNTWTITEPRNALSIVILLAVAIAVSTVVDLAARRTTEAARARAEADALTTLAGSVLRGADAVPAMLEELRETLRLTRVELRSAGSEPVCSGPASGATVPSEPLAGGTPAARGKGSPNTAPAPATGRPPGEPVIVTITPQTAFALYGRSLSADDLRVVTAVGLQAEAAIERDRLRAEARETRKERERTAMRTALLAAVSHDLRTPLAGIKAGVTALTSSGEHITSEDAAALLADVEVNTDRLQGLIDNLLDMSRLDAGAVAPVRQLIALDEIVPRAVSSLPAEAVRVDVPESLPLVLVDPGLIERAVANLVENALRYQGSSAPVVVTAGTVRGTVVLRVVDRGPGVPDALKTAMFTAFQRVGDAPDGHGVGLGLAVARGFVEANGGTLEAEDTPGGGLTMVITLPVAEGATP